MNNVIVEKADYGSESCIEDRAALEKRIEKLEQTVADLQRKSEDKPRSKGWLHKLIGTVSDEPAFLEALEYGRAYRQSDKPVEEHSEISTGH